MKKGGNVRCSDSQLSGAADTAVCGDKPDEKKKFGSQCLSQVGHRARAPPEMSVAVAVVSPWFYEATKTMRRPKRI